MPNKGGLPEIYDLAIGMESNAVHNQVLKCIKDSQWAVQNLKEAENMHEVSDSHVLTVLNAMLGYLLNMETFAVRMANARIKGLSDEEAEAVLGKGNVPKKRKERKESSKRGKKKPPTEEEIKKDKQLRANAEKLYREVLEYYNAETQVKAPNPKKQAEVSNRLECSRFLHFKGEIEV